MKAIITGAAGAIGQHVVKEFLAIGAEVVAIDQRPPAQPDPRATFVQCDLTNGEATRAAIHDADVVCHLAAIPNPYGVPGEHVLSVNVTSTYNVLEAARLNGIRRVVYSCSESSTGFGIHNVELKPLYVPIDEAHPCWPHESYSISKRFGEEMLDWYSRCYGIEGIALRYTWVWVERDRAGVQKIVKARLAGEPVTGWFGAYIAPEDVAQAFRCATSYTFPANRAYPFDAFYLAAEETFLSEPSLDSLKRQYGTLPEVRDPRYFEANPFASIFDTRKARQLLGWKPTKSWRDYQE